MLTLLMTRLLYCNIFWFGFTKSRTKDCLLKHIECPKGSCQLFLSGKQLQDTCRSSSPQILCKLSEKGDSPRSYMSLTLEQVLTHDALLDTAADISHVSYAVWKLRSEAHSANRSLTLQPCSLYVKPYALQDTTLSAVSLLQFKIGPMTFIHPVNMSSIQSPFLLGLAKDCLTRLQPLIDVKNLKVCTQVSQPLPFHFYFRENTVLCTWLSWWNTQLLTCDQTPPWADIIHAAAGTGSD